MTKVKCHKCGHTWDYGGSMMKATCPSCSFKTSVDHGE